MQIKRLVLHWGDPERGNPKRRKRNDSGETFVMSPLMRSRRRSRGGSRRMRRRVW